MKNVLITTEYITLGQFLKFTGIISSGFEAKIFLSSEEVLVNNEKENRRGRKLYKDDKIMVKGLLYIIVKECST